MQNLWSLFNLFWKWTWRLWTVKLCWKYNFLFFPFGNVYTTGKINENSVFQAQLETKQNRATKWTKSVPVCCKNFQKMTELKRNKSYQSYVKTMVIEKKKNVFSMKLVLETDWPFVWGYHWLWHFLTLYSKAYHFTDISEMNLILGFFG